MLHLLPNTHIICCTFSTPLRRTCRPSRPIHVSLVPGYIASQVYLLAPHKNLIPMLLGGLVWTRHVWLCNCSPLPSVAQHPGIYSVIGVLLAVLGFTGLPLMKHNLSIDTIWMESDNRWGTLHCRFGEQSEGGNAGLIPLSQVYSRAGFLRREVWQFAQTERDC